MTLLGTAAAPVHAGPSATALPEMAAQAAGLSEHIPTRKLAALAGSAFVDSIRRLDPIRRERAVLDEVLRGNIPDFLRRLVPVTLSYVQRGRAMSATIFVMPDYLAIGTDDDFLRIPMNLETATEIAARFGFLLPTRRIVDAVNAEARYHLQPRPLPPGPQMSSTAYYERHNAIIEQQARELGVPRGALVSGHKKDVVVTNLLSRTFGRIAIYGWHRPGGTPIQPLSTVHGACYEDYSHGIRLISQLAWEEGTLRPVREILEDAAAAPVLSDEGPLRGVFGGPRQTAPLLATFTPGSCSSGIRGGS